jgi:hypothetical protein
VIGLDVTGREDDAGVDGRRAALHRRGERDRRRAPSGADLDPPIFPSANVSSLRSSKPSVPT